MGKNGGKRASMAFLFTTSALLVVLVSLSFPSPADAFGRIPNFKLKSPSPPQKKPIYMPPTPAKKPIYVPSTPPKKSPPPVPKKPPHYVPSKPPKKPVKPLKPKSPPPPYKPDLTTSKAISPGDIRKIGGLITRIGEHLARNLHHHDRYKPDHISAKFPKIPPSIVRGFGKGIRKILSSESIMAETYTFGGVR